MQKILNNPQNGLYSFNRLWSNCIFQQVMDVLLAGLDFAIIYWDDILIKHKTKQQHSEHIQQVFHRIEDYGYKLSEEKCQFFRSNIKYLGQIIYSNRHRPDPSRMSVIINIPAPTLQLYNHFQGSQTITNFMCQTCIH